MKELKDFAHLYLGCKAILTNEDGERKKFMLNAYNLNYYRDYLSDIKLILRPLDSMTDEEVRELIQYDKMREEYNSLAYEFFPDRKAIEIQWSVEMDEGGIFPQNWTLSFVSMNAHDFSWCLKKGFDLFGLQAAGLAIYENETQNL